LGEKPIGEFVQTSWTFNQSGASFQAVMRAGGNPICAYLGDVTGQTLTAFIDRQRSPVHTAGPNQWTCFSYDDNCKSPSRAVRVEVNTTSPAFTCAVVDAMMDCQSSGSAQVYDARTGEDLGVMTTTGTLVLARAR